MTLPATVRRRPRVIFGQRELIQAPTPSAAAGSRSRGSVAGPVAGHEVSPIMVVIVGSSAVSPRSHKRRRTSRTRQDALDAYVPLDLREWWTGGRIGPIGRSGSHYGPGVRSQQRTGQLTWRS